MERPAPPAPPPLPATEHPPVAEHVRSAALLSLLSDGERARLAAITHRVRNPNAFGRTVEAMAISRRGGEQLDIHRLAEARAGRPEAASAPDRSLVPRPLAASALTAGQARRADQAAAIHDPWPPVIFRAVYRPLWTDGSVRMVPDSRSERPPRAADA